MAAAPLYVSASSGLFLHVLTDTDYCPHSLLESEVEFLM